MSMGCINMVNKAKMQLKYGSQLVQTIYIYSWMYIKHLAIDSVVYIGKIKFQTEDITSFEVSDMDIILLKNKIAQLTLFNHKMTTIMDSRRFLYV